MVVRYASARGFVRRLKRSSDGAARSERKREVAKGFGYLAGCRLPTRNLGGGAVRGFGPYYYKAGEKARRVKIKTKRSCFGGERFYKHALGKK